MPTPTYEKITAYTVPSAQASYTFTSIPSTYTDLVIVASVKGTVGSPTDYSANLEFNGVTSLDYSRTVLRGNGSAASSINSISLAYIQLQTSGYLSSSIFQTMIVNVMNYANTNTYKTVLSRAGQSDVITNATVGSFRKTDAITSAKFFLDSGTFGIGSTFTLYGIKAA